MYRGTYTLIGSELSMFTRKLEAQLRYQNIPHQWRYKKNEEAGELQARSGTHFIPLLQTPDGWMIHDTIAIGPMLHDRFYNSPVIPNTPNLRATCFVLEDFYNHWLPRHALHTRWCYPETVKAAGRNFGANMVLGRSLETDMTPEEEEQVAPVGEFMRDSFGLFACGVQGAGEDKKDAVYADYQALMSQLKTHFENHEFLLGNRACLADFVLAGTAKAHFLIDPEPKSWLGENEKMLSDYVERVWAGEKPDAEWNANDELPETLLPIIEHAVKNYQVFANAAIEAAAAGEKHFTLDLGHGPFEARSMKRLEKARLHVQDELERVNAKDTPLANTGAVDFYLKPPMLG